MVSGNYRGMENAYRHQHVCFATLLTSVAFSVPIRHCTVFLQSPCPCRHGTRFASHERFTPLLIELANFTYFYFCVEYLQAYTQDIGQPRVAEPAGTSRREIEDVALLEKSECANFPPLLAQPTIRYS